MVPLVWKRYLWFKMVPFCLEMVLFSYEKWDLYIFRKRFFFKPNSKMVHFVENGTFIFFKFKKGTFVLERSFQRKGTFCVFKTTRYLIEKENFRLISTFNHFDLFLVRYSNSKKGLRAIFWKAKVPSALKL